MRRGRLKNTILYSSTRHGNLLMRSVVRADRGRIDDRISGPSISSTMECVTHIIHRGASVGRGAVDGRAFRGAIVFNYRSSGFESLFILTRARFSN